MGRTLRRRSRETNYWPGFVDVLSTMLIIVLFLLLVFTLAQLFLNQVLSGRNEALARLNQQVSELSDMLQMERASNADLRHNMGQLSAELASSTAARDTLSSQLAEAERQLSASVDALADAKSKAAANEQTLKELQGRYGESQQALTQEQQISAEARHQVELLNEQIAALRTQLSAIQKALDISEKKAAAQKVQIVNLGKRLNLALAGKVEQLSKYRSEFFGRLRAVLGNRADIRIVGDRFVLQSEVLFPTASADLTPPGQAQIDRLADTLKQISKEIPSNIPWVLRVDGFTDKRPIHTPQFPSNWELSTARAISVVRRLIDDGIPPDRLTANGFGQYHPLAKGNTPEDYAKNRRIELKLTER